MVRYSGGAAAGFYTAIFRNSKILEVARSGHGGQEIHRKPAGSVMTIALQRAGQGFAALNGGPEFQCNEAASFQVHCDTQEEIDYYWTKLSEGGDDNAQQYGVSGRLFHAFSRA